MITSRHENEKKKNKIDEFCFFLAENLTLDFAQVSISNNA